MTGSRSCLTTPGDPPYSNSTAKGKEQQYSTLLTVKNGARGLRSGVRKKFYSLC